MADQQTIFDRLTEKFVAEKFVAQHLLKGYPSEIYQMKILADTKSIAPLTPHKCMSRYLYATLFVCFREKKKEREREELWKKLEKLEVSKKQASASNSSPAKAASGSTQGSPGSQSAATGNQISKG